jgi:phenylalanyl-tRNA synthetase beta chain
MPTVGISIARLRKLMRADVDDARLEQLLDQLGCDLEGITTVRRYVSRHSDYAIELTPSESLPLTDPGSGVTGEKPEDVWQLAGEEQVVRMELLPVRPDLFDAGGLARALRGYLGVDVGLPQYRVTLPGPLGEGEGRAWRVDVDAAIADPAFRRSYIQCAIVRELHVDEELLRAMMRLQEHLHWALARDRKFASIGVYDLAKLKSPLRYTLVDRESFRFTPLFWGHREPVSPATMLAEHPKGVGYAHLVEGLDQVPALLAANDVVLSLPPIINAEESKVTTGTRDVLIDVTGGNLPIVTRALAIMATSLLELDTEGLAHLERVEIHYPDRVEHTPPLASETFELNPQRAAALIGVALSREDVRELLLKMRHGVEDPNGGSTPPVAPASAPVKLQASGSEPQPAPQAVNDSGGSVTGITGEGARATTESLLVTVGPFRHDIMHEVDLIEDVAIAYGYHHVQPTLVPSFTAGATLAVNDLARRAANVMCGLGFLESLSLVLTSERDHYDKLRRPVNERRVTVANPISVDQTMLREHLYSGLLDLLSSNTDQPLPQRVFEVGDVVGYFEDAPDTVGSAVRLTAVGTPVRASADTAQLASESHLQGTIRDTQSSAVSLTADPTADALTGVPTEDSPPTELRQLAGAICATRAGYADGRGVLDALLHELKLDGVEYRADDNPSALPGRAAALYGADGQRVGELFEVHPEVLEAWRLENPVVAFSLTLGPVQY